MPKYSRKDMPQVNTQNLGKAISMAKSKVKVTKGMNLAAELKPSQKELIPSKVKGVAKKYDKPTDMKPLIISKDNYIIDGHHRWAAAIYKFGNDVQIPTFTLHLKRDKAIEVYKMISISLNEAMSLAARKKLARKSKSKLKRGMKKRIKKMKKKRSNSDLQKAAIRQAKNILIKKMMKKAPSELSIQQKMKFSEKIAKKPGKIQKIAKKIFPKLKQAEIDRVKKMKARNTQKNEGWSNKYKKSIDCNNPKGFSQKAHCDGKKKRELKEIYFDRFGNKCKNPTTLDGRCIDKYHPSPNIRETLQYNQIPPSMMKDFLPTGYMSYTTPEEKKKALKLYKDLKNTINKFWKDHKINRKIK